MRIIPAIDIIDGKCVRLTKGDYDSKCIYNENPLEVALQFEDNGIQFLHLVDLDGAKSNRIVHYKILEKIASKTKLKIDFGGGIKSSNDLKIAFESGADQVTGGSIAIKNPILFQEWLTHYGSQKIILGADVVNGKIAISGWTEESKEPLFPFVKKFEDFGLEYAICTDISKDGMLEGPGLDLYTEFREQIPNVKLIASGGISSVQDLLMLKRLGCEGAIVGKALYENRISLKEISAFINSND